MLVGGLEHFYHSYTHETPWKTPSQWSFQEPKLEVPTIYKAYFSGLFFRPKFQGIPPQNIALYDLYGTVPP